MCERAEEIRREEQKRKEAEEVDLYTWFNRRHDMDGVDDYDDEREDD